MTPIKLNYLLILLKIITHLVMVSAVIYEIDLSLTAMSHLKYLPDFTTWKSSNNSARIGFDDMIRFGDACHNLANYIVISMTTIYFLCLINNVASFMMASFGMLRNSVEYLHCTLLLRVISLADSIFQAVRIPVWQIQLFVVSDVTLIIFIIGVIYLMRMKETPPDARISRVRALGEEEHFQEVASSSTQECH